VCCSILLSGKTPLLIICMQLQCKGGTGHGGEHVRVPSTLHQLPWRCG
jgi:hypothetical protein